MKHFFGIFFLSTALLAIPLRTYAKTAVRCEGVFRTSTEAQEFLRANLDSSFQKVPEKAAAHIVKGLADRIEKQSLSAADLQKFSEKFYNALDSGSLKKPFQNLVFSRHRQAVRDAHVFHVSLKKFLAEQNIVLKESTLEKIRDSFYRQRSLFSMAHFVAFNATLSVVTHGVTGWLPVYLPKLSNVRFGDFEKNGISRYEIGARYYERVYSATLKVASVAMLAYFLANYEKTLDEGRLILDSLLKGQKTVEVSKEAQENIQESLTESVSAQTLAESTEALEKAVAELMNSDLEQP